MCWLAQRHTRQDYAPASWSMVHRALRDSVVSFGMSFADALAVLVMVHGDHVIGLPAPSEGLCRKNCCNWPLAGSAVMVVIFLHVRLARLNQQELQGLGVCQKQRTGQATMVAAHVTSRALLGSDMLLNSSESCCAHPACCAQVLCAGDSGDRGQPD